MDFVTPLYNTLQAQGALDHTRAVTADTQALAQNRLLANQLLQQQTARDDLMRQRLMNGPSFSNPTGDPGAAAPNQNPPVQQTTLLGIDYDPQDPLVQSLRNAQQGVNLASQRVQMAKEVGDLKGYADASNHWDDQQKEYRLAQKDVLAESERRVKEAAQAFGSVSTPEELKSALQYVNDNISKKQAMAIATQLQKVLPDPMNATPEQITAAVDPIRNRYASMGDQYRYAGSMQASQDRANTLAQRKVEAEQKAARQQAGLPAEELTDGGRAVAAEMTRQGLNIPGGRGKGGIQVAALNQIASDLEEQGLPPSAVTQGRIDFRNKQATTKDFTSGPTAKNITSINTSLGHLQTLQDLGAALDNSDVQGINKVVNMISSQFGNPDLNNAQTAAQAVGEEMMRTFRVVGASEKEAAKWETRFNQALQSPDQMKGVVKTGADLLRSRLEALDDQYRRGTGSATGFPDIISPKNQAFLGDIGVKYNVTRAGQKAAAAAPAGSAPPTAATTTAVPAAAPLPPKAELVSGQLYQTPKGPLWWNGSAFEKR